MLCPKCSHEITDGITICPKCGTIIEQPLISTVAESKTEKPSGLAIISIITGYLSLVLCCLFLVPLILSIIELRKIKLGKSSKLGENRAITGLALSITSLVFFILFTLYLPGFLSSRIRSQVDHAKGEMKMIAAALENYAIDHSGASYPYVEYDEKGNTVLLKSLSTPVSYIRELTPPFTHFPTIPKDPFSPDGKQSYRYFAGPVDDEAKNYWILASNGPDKKNDINVTKYNPLHKNWLILYGIPLQYDPTNGTKSPGDIWRTGRN